jgi:hypothetical protein
MESASSLDDVPGRAGDGFNLGLLEGDKFLEAPAPGGLIDCALPFAYFS